MSETRPSATSAAAPLNLEQQRKRAKELLRAYRRREGDAIARVQRWLPATVSELKLADAQHVVAKECGFTGWTALKLHAVNVQKSRRELIDAILRAALDGDRQAVDSALAIAPDVATASLHVATALADETASLRQLGRLSKEAVHASFGILAGSPLAYLCNARLGREKDEVQLARARIAKALLAAGADPNECIDAPHTPAGKLSVLTMAAQHAASPELVRELLRAGAVTEPPGSTAGPPAPPLVGAAMGGNLRCLRALLEAGAPKWQAREALEVAVERNDAEMAQALLAYGCFPNQAGRWRGRNGGCLHAALALGRKSSFLELLLEGGATVAARDRDGRSPLAIAVQLARTDAANLFRQRGASDDELTEMDRLIGACFAHDGDRVHSLLRDHPALLDACSTSDHQNVCRAVRHGNVAALELLLRAGFDPNVPDDDGDTALHLAVRGRDFAAIGLLLANGASSELRSYANVSARELAQSEGDAELRSKLLASFKGATRWQEAEETAEDVDGDDVSDQLESRRKELATLFERALDAMTRGDLEELRELLDQEPSLPTTRSHRYHRATLLHYLGNNGTERTIAPENVARIAELLLQRGAVVDASCHMYGGGPYQTTLGMAATTDASFYPRGVLAELLTALVSGGARIHEADGRSRALEGAIEYGAVIALRTLAAHGARAYDLVTAAALGDLARLDLGLRLASRDERVRALESAAAFSQTEALERLFQAGAELDAYGVYGGTALHKAAAANAVDSVRWLLAHGADPETRDRTHQGTPADWARHFGAKEALAMLTETG